MELSRKEKLMKTQICAFCMNVWSADTRICPSCNEYKGLMPLNRETLEYLDLDPIEWEEDGYNLD